MPKVPTISAAVLIAEWPDAAQSLYRVIETALFGTRGLRVEGVRQPTDALIVSIGGKEAVRLRAVGDGLVCSLTTPKPFREAALALDLSEQIRSQFKATKPGGSGTITAATPADATALAAIVRAKLDYVSRV